MHIQTATATMAFSSGPHSGDISPTLTNPEMILPYEDFTSPQDSYRADSLGDDWRGVTSGSFSIGTAHGNMMPITTPIIYGNGTMLSDIGEVTEAESTVGRKIPSPAERRMLKQAQNAGISIRSSPTVGYDALRKRSKTGSHQRKISIESTSTITSEGQSTELFRDFDDGVSIDDSVFQGDDEESIADSYTEGVIASETERLSRNDTSFGKDEDRNSSAALSRRAEQILLNAKKRLNNMEGNLTRARSSLFVTPSGSLSSIHSSSPLSRSTPSPPVNSLPAAPALRVPPSLHRQLHTPSDSPIGSSGHARVQSENSISTPIRAPPFSVRFPVRASSAAARYNGRGEIDANQPSPPLTHKSDSPREDTRAGSRTGFSSSMSRTSPPHGSALEPLTENDIPEFDADRATIRSNVDGTSSPFEENRGLNRSTSSMQMRDLKDQMSDLKGRLSVLRDRARDDTMKRRSLQSLRTPSPFTAAEQWYAGSKTYGDSPLSADGGVAQPPWKDEERKEEEAKNKATNDQVPEQAPDYAQSDVTSIYEDVAESHNITPGFPLEPLIDELEEEEGQEEEEEQGESFETAGEEDLLGEGEDDFENDYNDEMVDRDEADDYESDASLYHDTIPPISHEDREDAFDYEHFFLHSAMGTISQQRLARRGSAMSFSSDDSVETTRGPSVSATNGAKSKNGNERAMLGHLRSESTDTISTMATFATAREENGSENGNEDDENDDNFAVQYVNAPLIRTATPVTAKRSTFGRTFNAVPEVAEEDRTTPDVSSSSSSTPIMHNKEERNGTNIHRPSIASFSSFESTGTTRSFPLVNKPKATSSPEPSSQDKSSAESTNNGGSPVHMLAKEDQLLVEKLVASLGKCVLGLQEAGQTSYDGRVWRRRLDAARRVLEGEEGAI